MAQGQIENQFDRSLESNDGEMNFQNILNFIWRLKWWMLICAATALSIAYIYVKLQTPMYSCSTMVKLLDYGDDKPELSVLVDVTGRSESRRIDDEILILQSPSLMTQVVEDLHLNYFCYQYKLPLFHTTFPLFRSVLNVKKEEFYQDSPFALEVTFDDLYSSDTRPWKVSVEFSTISDDIYEIKELIIGSEVVSERGKVHAFGDTLAFPGLSVRLMSNEGRTMIKGDSYVAMYADPETVAEQFAAKVAVSIKDGYNMRPTHLMFISIVDSKPRRGADILNRLVSSYNRQAREFKSAATYRSLEFINERLLSISKELGSVEANYRDYQSSHNYIEGEGRVAPAYSQFETNLADLRMQKAFIKMIKDELGKMGSGDYSLIPVNAGLSDNGLNQVIDTYNTLVSERNRLLANSSESNPSVLNYNELIVEAKSDIYTSMLNLEKVYQLREEELTSMLKAAKDQRMSVPTRQFDLARMSRQQQIIEPLFLSLNQRKEELQLSLFSITDNVRVITSAKPGSSPISPDAKRIYLFALMLGCLLPVAVILARKLFRTRVETSDDVKKYIDRPVLAAIPKSLETDELSDIGSRSTKAEAFRMLRSNLQFMEGKVIHIVSSVSGEGKSYVSVNLAISLSHLGRKVCLVGLDLRKPSLSRILSQQKVQEGRHSVVGYLIGKTDDPASVVSRYECHGFVMDILFSGSVPPNPTELLSNDRMGRLMEWCRANYDYVLIDCAPFFPVPDASIVNRFADITLYIVRSDFTQLRMLRDINGVVSRNALCNVSIILNDVNMDAVKYRYGYGHGYGYGEMTGGVGYGYGYGYAEPKPHAFNLDNVRSCAGKVSALAGKAVSVIGKAIGKAESATGRATGKTVPAVRRAVVKAVTATGKATGKVVSATGKSTGKAVPAVGRAKEKVVSATRKSTGKAVPAVGRGAGKALIITGKSTGKAVPAVRKTTGNAVSVTKKKTNELKYGE